MPERGLFADDGEVFELMRQYLPVTRRHGLGDRAALVAAIYARAAHAGEPTPTPEVVDRVLTAYDTGRPVSTTQPISELEHGARQVTADPDTAGECGAEWGWLGAAGPATADLPIIEASVLGEDERPVSHRRPPLRSVFGRRRATTEPVPDAAPTAVEESAPADDWWGDEAATGDNASPAADPATNGDHTFDDAFSGMLTRPRARGRGRTVLLAVAAAVVLLAVAVTAVWVNGGQSPRSAPPIAAPPVSRSATVPAAAADDPCPSSTSATVMRGNDPGDQTTGPGVIKAWNRAYYTTRSAAAAKAVTLPNAVSAEPVLQAFIDRRPAGTTYCLTITPQAAAPGLFGVEVIETPPAGGVPVVWRQQIQTTQANGKTWIASIRAAT